MDNISIINNFLSKEYIHNNEELDLKNIILNDIEKATGCILYNKEQLIKETNDNFLSTKSNIEIIRKFIKLNLIAEINFNDIFKSQLNFSIVFKYDKIIIFHNNIVIDSKNIKNIREKISCLINLSIKNFYIDNIINIIIKFINKELSVRFNCINIPVEYWKLFKIKCIKHDKDSESIYEKYISVKDIKSGYIYKQNHIIEPIKSIDNDMIEIYQ